MIARVMKCNAKDLGRKTAMRIPNKMELNSLGRALTMRNNFGEVDDIKVLLMFKR
jgi:hypothetical protein